jgi:hypothetical protein
MIDHKGADLTVRNEVLLRTIVMGLGLASVIALMLFLK